MKYQPVCSRELFKGDLHYTTVQYNSLKLELYRVKVHTDRTRFDNATRIFSF
jgi:hypothetical protein